MEEDHSYIPVGIVLSMVSYVMYIYILDMLMQTFKTYEWIQIFRTNNIMMFTIYMIPLILLLYINVPILLRRYLKGNST